MRDIAVKNPGIPGRYFGLLLMRQDAGFQLCVHFFLRGRTAGNTEAEAFGAVPDAQCAGFSFVSLSDRDFFGQQAEETFVF